jgi:ribosomal protein S18 acetylase RimI-like enzyme
LRGFSISDLGRREISALCVDPDFERNGIGRNLHNSAVDLLFSKGLESISIIAAPYTRAQKFLHAAGWRLTDAEPDGDYRLELRADVWRVRRRRF